MAFIDEEDVNVIKLDEVTNDDENNDKENNDHDVEEFLEISNEFKVERTNEEEKVSLLGVPAITMWSVDPIVTAYLNSPNCSWTSVVSPKSPIMHAVGILIGQRISAHLAQQYRQQVYQHVLRCFSSTDLTHVTTGQFAQVDISHCVPERLHRKIKEFTTQFKMVETQNSLTTCCSSWLDMWRTRCGKHSRLPVLPYFGAWSWHAFMLMMMIQTNQSHQYPFMQRLWTSDYTLKHQVFPVLIEADSSWKGSKVSLEAWLHQKEKQWGPFANQITFVLWRSCIN